jgi:hypothetical protein
MTIAWVKDDMAVLFPEFGEECEVAAYLRGAVLDPAAEPRRPPSWTGDADKPAPVSGFSSW